MILVDIEGVEQLLNVFSFWGHDLTCKCVPHHRDLLEQLHKVLQLDISTALCEDQPSESRFLQIVPPEDDSQVVQVVLLGDEAISIVVNEIEDAAYEGVFSAEQSKSSSKLLIVHPVSMLTKLVESIRDEFLFFLAKLCCGFAWFRIEVFCF